MGIGWHNEQGTPNLRGRHVASEPSHGPGTFGRHGMSLEPEVDFDWESVEDPAGRLMEQMLEKKLPLTRPQAEAVTEIRRREEALSGDANSALLKAAFDWIFNARVDAARNSGRGKPDGSGDGLGERRIGIRAVVALREIMPEHPLARVPYRALGKIFGVRFERFAHLRNSWREHFRR